MSTQGIIGKRLIRLKIKVTCVAKTAVNANFSPLIRYVAITENTDEKIEKNHKRKNIEREEELNDIYIYNVQ